MIHKPQDKKLLTRRRLLGLLAVGAGVTVAAGAYLSRDLQVKRRTLRLPRWDADGFRVVQISDLHMNDAAGMALGREAVRLAVAEKPDLVVYTGDFSNHSDPSIMSLIPQAFEGLQEAGCPCLAIMGNHDYWHKYPERVAEQVALTKLRLLRNETVDLGGVVIAGLDDALEKRHDPSILKGVDAKSVLALLHEPDSVSDMPLNVSLQLSGHSHGGEVCLPGGLPLYTPRGSKRYWSGFYDGARVPLFVSKGAGTVGPGRVFCPAEINVLTLKPA